MRATHSASCNNIANKYGCVIERIYDNLSEQEALDLEEKTIKYYVYELGYSIALTKDFELRDRSNEKFLCNHTLGGEGIKGSHRMSDEEKEKRRNKMLGNNNIAKRKEVREKLSKHAKENNSFAIPEVVELIVKKQKERLNNPKVKKQRSRIISIAFPVWTMDRKLSCTDPCMTVKPTRTSTSSRLTFHSVFPTR